jgi:DNA-binding transcriptional MerR regulator
MPRNVPNGLMGTGLFVKRARITVARMREAQALGIIRPTKTDSGWRTFSEADVTAAKRWKAAGFPIG